MRGRGEPAPPRRGAPAGTTIAARLELLPDLGEALMEIGEFAWAEVFLDEALAGASELRDETLRADALLTQLLVRHHAAEDLDRWRGDIERETKALIPILEEREAHEQLAKAWRMVAFIHATVCRWEEAASAQQRALEIRTRRGRPAPGGAAVERVRVLTLRRPDPRAGSHREM